MIDTTTEFIAIRKNRCTFPIRLQVTHLAGVGEDSMFMGVIQVWVGWQKGEVSFAFLLNLIIITHVVTSTPCHFAR